MQLSTRLNSNVNISLGWCFSQVPTGSNGTANAYWTLSQDNSMEIQGYGVLHHAVFQLQQEVIEYNHDLSYFILSGHTKP